MGGRDKYIIYKYMGSIQVLNSISIGEKHWSGLKWISVRLGCALHITCSRCLICFEGNCEGGLQERKLR